MSIFKAWGLQKRVVAGLMLFGLLPAIALYGIFYWQAEAIRKGFEAPFLQQAEYTLDVVDRTLYERVGDVQAFALNSAFRDPNNWQGPNQAVLTSAINEYMKLYGLYRVMMVLDTNGVVHAMNTFDQSGKPLKGASLVGQSFAKEPWFQKTMAGDFIKDTKGNPTTVHVEGPYAFPIANSLYRVEDSYGLIFASPIKDFQGRTIGIWVNFADFGFIENIFAELHKKNQRTGQNNTEVTLLDSKGYVISEYNPEKTDIQNKNRDFKVLGKFNLVERGVKAAAEAISGKAGVMNKSFHARKKMEMVAGFAPSRGYEDFKGLGWSILARGLPGEIYKPVNVMDYSMLIAISVTMAIIVVVGFFLGRYFATPIGTLADVMRRVAGGDKTLVVPYQDNKTEIGQMAKACQFFKDVVAKAEQLTEDQKIAAETSRQDLKHKMLLLTDEIEQEMKETITHVLENADTVVTISKEMSQSANKVSIESQAVSQATERAQMNVDSVAAATEELSISVNEISQQVSHAARTAQSAVTSANTTNITVQKLADAVRSVGDVVLLISDIAEQTNLLALNATIEAARAGEAGKGFAVVAAEVKNLANQTTKATDGITQQITAIQNATENSVTAIEEIVKTIQEIDNISSSIAAAVEEQGAATNEISSNTQQAAQGTREVSDKIVGVNTEFQHTNELSAKVQMMTDDVMNMVQGLRNRMIAILRDSYAGNRRTDTRYDASGYTANVTFKGKAYPCSVKDISSDGIAIFSKEIAADGLKDDSITFDLSGYPSVVNGHIVGCAAGEIVRVCYYGDTRQKSAMERFIKSRFGQERQIA